MTSMEETTTNSITTTNYNQGDYRHFYGCWGQFNRLPIRVHCMGPFQSIDELDKQLDKQLGTVDYRIKNNIATTVIPVCKYLPEFINSYRVLARAKKDFVI